MTAPSGTSLQSGASADASMDDKWKTYWADCPPTVVKLDAAPHFHALTPDQKAYAHHIARASFSGTRIILRQVSPESEAIYDLIISLYRSCHGDWQRLQRQAGVSDEALRHFLEYATQFLGNSGNYKGFGDSKFIPRLSPEDFEKIVCSSSECQRHFAQLGGRNGSIFATTEKPSLMHLGFPDQGHLSNYYPDSHSITQAEIDAIGDFLATEELLPENTRLRKTPNGDFEILVASGIDRPPSAEVDCRNGTVHFNLPTPLEGKTLSIIYGDHREEMAKAALHMKHAEKHAANDMQKDMMSAYAKSFGNGSLKAFKESQKLWVKDIGPAVESNIGFIESYRDPAGVRAEWEGFAAMVNKERTKAFGKLVASAPEMVPKLPWSKDFEKTQFEPPDFTSLEVLAFASSGIPAGINIPNYDDIRREIGFKNVSLGNVLSANAPNEPIPFIHADDLEMYRKYRDAAFEVQVGIHELLGHGTGKLLQETSPGVFNFDEKAPPISPITSQPIKTYYKPGQTWSSVFGAIAASYEECRAECVAMVLACDPQILAIFGFETSSATSDQHQASTDVDLDGPAGDVLHACYLSMARAGLAALEFWDPASRKWGQAHMQARFSILRVMLAAGNGLVQLEPTPPASAIRSPLDAASSTPDHSSSTVSPSPASVSEGSLEVRVDRSRITRVGRPAIEAYLQRLHVYKATADRTAGAALYAAATNVDDWWAHTIRPRVMAQRPPRKVLVQANTVLRDTGAVDIVEYPPTLEGMIQSWAERDV